jgi:hypothetical protein
MEEVNKNTEVDNTDKKLHISDVMNSTLTKIFLDIFEAGIELGKKIEQDIEGKLTSPKKGTAITEMVQFQKIYDEVIKKYCS